MPSDELQLRSEESSAQPVKKKSRTRKIALLFSLLLLLCPIVGGGIYLWIHFDVTQTLRDVINNARSQDAAPEPETKPAVKEEGKKADPSLPRTTSSGVAVIPLTRFEVNIADPSGKRYLLLGVEVEVNDKVGIDEIRLGEPRIRDAVIMLLSSKSYEALASPEGKLNLKNEIAARMNQALGTQRVVRVFFTEFMIR